MSRNEYMSGALQENILTMLCFDTASAPIIRGSVRPETFDSSLFQEIAKRAISYQETYQEAPGSHITDIFEDILEGKDDKKASLYHRTFEQMFELKNDINSEYVINQLSSFVRKQNLKTGLTDAVKLIKDGHVDQAEVAISSCLNSGVVSFQPGTFFWDPSQVCNFLTEEDSGIHIGIEALDALGICPAPKELFLCMAPAGRGKTWMLIHMAKNALLQRKKVLHVTLEMSEAKMAGRYTQSMFSISKRQQEIVAPTFEYDEVGRLSTIGFDHVTGRPHLTMPDIEKHITKKITSMRKLPLIIKQFPTGALTINALEAYLESLERFEKFVPDLIILDYADLMKIDSGNLRIDTGSVYKGLRGMAVSRNVAIATATQSNRQAEDVRLITKKHLAEDYSKAAIVDNLITYNQTMAEKELNLARLFVAKGRNDKDGQTVLISQAYEMGQFCLDSTLMSGSKYWKEVDAITEARESDGEGGPRKKRGGKNGEEEDEKFD